MASDWLDWEERDFDELIKELSSKFSEDIEKVIKDISNCVDELFPYRNGKEKLEKIIFYSIEVISLRIQHHLQNVKFYSFNQLNETVQAKYRLDKGLKEESAQEVRYYQKRGNLEKNSNSGQKVLKQMKSHVIDLEQNKSVHVKDIHENLKSNQIAIDLTINIHKIFQDCFVIDDSEIKPTTMKIACSIIDNWITSGLVEETTYGDVVHPILLIEKSDLETNSSQPKEKKFCLVCNLQMINFIIRKLESKGRSAAEIICNIKEKAQMLFSRVDMKCAYDDLTEDIYLIRTEHLKEVFLLLRKFSLKASKKKCLLNQTSLIFLGFNLSKKGYKPSNGSIKHILHRGIPKTRKKFLRFLVEINYFRPCLRKFPFLSLSINCKRKPSIQMSSTNPKFIEMLSYISEFLAKLRYVKGKDNYVPDYLSRISEYEKKANKSMIEHTDNACVICKQSNAKQLVAPLARTFETAETPMNDCAVDILGPLPISLKNSEYAVVLCDNNTRFFWAFSTKSREPEET
ncbi:Hypothetical protein SRAE_0000076800 [Strongyloides ratti]|uniref:Reverse transcriptase domain-containing protein n=1 Tax=Strongyloides ratti TaxID=34506 RepID=A0A090MTL4_STRRB|nr:Hypothetical protein SRAE_0000076800 [Strongyloides ratti]CEF61653.1 Hypothetical protein SRAE_0000076800 [Strongyloides ratti]